MRRNGKQTSTDLTLEPPPRHPPLSCLFTVSSFSFPTTYPIDIYLKRSYLLQLFSVNQGTSPISRRGRVAKQNANWILDSVTFKSLNQMAPAAKSGGKSKTGAAPGATSQNQQRSIQTRSQKAGLQVCDLRFRLYVVKLHG